MWLRCHVAVADDDVALGVAGVAGCEADGLIAGLRREAADAGHHGGEDACDSGGDFDEHFAVAGERAAMQGFGDLADAIGALVEIGQCFAVFMDGAEE